MHLIDLAQRASTSLSTSGDLKEKDRRTGRFVAQKEKLPDSLRLFPGHSGGGGDIDTLF